MTDQVFNLNWGSDLQFQFAWPNGAGSAADLTGYTISVLEYSAQLTGFIAAQIVNASTGVVQIDVQWDSSFPKNQTLKFRLQIQSGAYHDSTNELGIIYT
ncbi:MAG: hypothetical protein AAF943_15785 [Pseudomonadota bacterium]